MAQFSAYYPFTRAQYLIASDNYPTYTDDGVFQPFLFTAANYGTGIWSYESILLSDGTNTVFSALFNSSGVQLAGSEISTTSSNDTLQRSASLSLVNNEVYHPRIRTSTTITTSWGPVIPRLIFDANYTKPASIESHIGLYGEFSYVVWGAYFSPLSNDLAPNTDVFLYNQSNWETGTLFYHETWMRSRNAAQTATAGISSTANASNIIVASEIATTSTTFARYRSADFVPVDNGTHALAVKSTGTDINTGIEISHSKVVAIVPTAEKFELHHPLSSGYLNANQTSYVKYTASRLRFNEAVWTPAYVKNIWLESVMLPGAGITATQALSYWTGPTTDFGTIAGTEIDAVGQTTPVRVRSNDLNATFMALDFSAIMQARWKVSSGSTADFLSGGKLIFRVDESFDLDLSPNPALTTGFNIDLAEPSGIYQVNRSAGGSIGAVGSIATNAALHTTGNLLVAFISRQSTNAITVTDTAGNTWQQLGTDYTEAGNANTLAIWYAFNITGNAANVVTATLTSGTAGYFVIGVREFAGFGTYNPAGSFAGADGAGATATTASLALNGTTSLIFSGVEHDSQGITAGASFFGNTLPADAFFFDQYRVVTAAAAATATGGGVLDWRIIGGVFNARPTASVHDLIAITENVTTAVTGGGPGVFTASVSDTLTITESVSTTRVFTASVFDALTIADGIGFVDTFYFDTSDGGPTDADSNWTNDANAFDGSISTGASASLLGSASTRFLLGQGTNAVAAGPLITQVRARVNTSYISFSGTANIYGAVYTDGLAELLGTAVSGAAGRDGAGWGSYINLSTPTGGWTYPALQALEVKNYYADETGIPDMDSITVRRTEIEVTTKGVERIIPPASTTAIDTVAITENIALLNIKNLSVFDALTITENVAATVTGATFAVSVSDTLNITEVVTLLETSFVSAVDTLTITESVTLLNTITQVTFDAVVISENVATTFVGAGFSTSVFDAIGITEAVTLLETSFVSVFDAVGITESVTTLRTANQSVADQLTISESVTAVLTLSQSVNDALGISESVTVLRVANQSVFDAVGIAESVTTERSTIASVFDALTITESVTAQLGTINVSVFDAVGIAESVAAVIEGGGFASTDVSITENITLQLIQTTYPISVSDTIAITETVKVENNLFAPVGLFARVQSVTSKRIGYDFSGNTTSHVLDIPSGTANGDLLVMIFGTRLLSGGTINTPSGWTNILANVANAYRLFVFFRVADGTEGSTVTVTSTTATNSSSFIYRILDSKNGSVEITDNGGGATTHNPPSLTPTFGASNNLWIAGVTYMPDNTTLSSYPSDYSELQTISGTSNLALNSAFAIASKNSGADTEDPGEFILNANKTGLSFTLAAPGTPGVGELVVITESITTSVTYAVSVTDSLSISDIAVANSVFSQSVADTLAIIEAITTALTANLSVNDPIGITEFVSPNAVYTAVVSDTVTTTEDVVALRVLTASVSDTVGITEAVTTNITRNIVTFDAVTISEAVTADSSFQVSVFDALTITENVQRLFTASTSVSDTLVITEDITSAVTRFASVNTAIAITETVLPQRVHLASVFDALTISESQAFRLEANYEASVFDLISIIETISNEVNTRASVNDQIIITENVNPNQIFNAQLIWDSIVMADVVTDRETIRFSPEPIKYRPQSKLHKIIPRGVGGVNVNRGTAAQSEKIAMRGSVNSR